MNRTVSKMPLSIYTQLTTLKIEETGKMKKISGLNTSLGL